MTEADTCRKYVVPLLQAAGWDDDPHSIAEQRFFTDASCAKPNELRNRWAHPVQRSDIIQQLTERGIDFHQLTTLAAKPDAVPLDLLCHLAFNAPLLTRRQRAERIKKQQSSFFNYFGPNAREILKDLLEKYAADGELQFTLPEVLKLPPISHHGNVNEIISKFGGADKLRTAITRLQSLIPRNGKLTK